jgi:hypothetical protein
VFAEVIVGLSSDQILEWSHLVLKKAGIVVSIAAAGVVGLTPLAFASDHEHGHDRSHHDYGYNHVGLLGGVAEGVGGLLHGVGETLHPLLRGLVS